MKPVKAWTGCGTNYARTIEKRTPTGRIPVPFRISCTESEDRAAENLAAKFYGPKATVRYITPADRETLVRAGYSEPVIAEVTHVIIH